MATACFLTSLGQYVGIVNPRHLALVGPWVFKKYQVRRDSRCLHGTVLVGFIQVLIGRPGKDQKQGVH